MKNSVFYTMSFLAGLAMVVPVIISGYVSEKVNTTYLGFAIFFGIFALIGAWFGVLCKDASKKKMLLTSVLLTLPTTLLLNIFLFIGDRTSPDQVSVYIAYIEPFIASFIGIFLMQLWRKAQDASNSQQV